MNSVEISTVPAKDGFEWLRLSFRLFRMQWLRYCALAAMFILISQVAWALSGGVLVFFLKPILSVGFLAAAWHHERGETPEVAHLLAGFRSNLKALLPMGLLHLLGLVAAFLIASAVSGIDIAALRAVGDKPELASETLSQFMLIAAVCMLPVNAALWFAPALVVFTDAGFLKAITLSFQAWTRNIVAILIYAVATLGYVLLTLLVIAPLALTMSEPVRLLIAMIVMVPLMAIYMISDYVSYRRVFHRSERLQPSRAGTKPG